MNQLAHLECVIMRGAFPGERAYRVKQANGADYEGRAPDHYFRNPDGEPLEDEQPGPGEEIKGMLSVIVVRDEGERLRVAPPDNEAITVMRSQVAARALETERVPV